MKIVLRLSLALLLLSAAATNAVAQAGRLKLVEVLPAQLVFAKTPNGTLQAPVVGDATKPGLYAIRVRIPAGTRVLPHFHPDDRIVVVLGGTLYVGFGEKFDESSMKTMPPGSVFTEPARQVHSTWAKDAGVVLHVVGNGPTGTTQVPAQR